MSTNEIRTIIGQALETTRPDLVSSYMETRQLRARKSPDIAQGVARIHRELAEMLGAETGEPARLFLGNRRLDIELETKSYASPTEIQLNESDLRELGVLDGARIGLRFRMK